jgi:hypothetical protein
LKRRIAQATVPGAPIASIIGLVSIGPENIKDVQTILDDLERDLKRDEACQIVLPKPEIDSAKREGLLIWCRNWSIVHKIKDALSHRLDVKITYDIEEVRSFPQGRISYVLVFGPDIDKEECSEILRKTQNLSKPKAIFKISAKMGSDTVDGGIDIVISEVLDIKLLTSCILSAFSMPWINDRHNKAQKYLNALSAIGSATHQLNQPLQIILER